MSATTPVIDADTQALLSECEARHGHAVALRALVQLVGLENFDRGIDAFYDEHPTDEPEETQGLFSGLGWMYSANHDWMRKAVASTMAGFEWTMDELPKRWQDFIERLLLSDYTSQSKALLAILDALPDQEPFLTDLFAICEAIKEARPFALVQMVDGKWPAPCDPDRVDSALSPIELSLGMKTKHED